MLKRFVALAIICTSIALAVGIYNGRASSSLLQDIQPGDIGTLHGDALLAAAAGESEYNQSENILFEDTNLTDALSRYTVIVATPTYSKSYALDQFSIGTWVKFTVNETLSQKPLLQCANCPPLSSPPSELLPLNANEILVLQPGGSTIIDGVTITSSVPDFPSFTLNQRYLLFVDLDAARQVAAVKAGPAAVYTIDGNNNFVPVFSNDDGTSSAVASGLTSSYGNNLSQMRAALNPPPPSSCDPDGSLQSNCEDAGGTWNSTTCRCSASPCTRKPWLCE